MRSALCSSQSNNTRSSLVSAAHAVCTMPALTGVSRGWASISCMTRVLTMQTARRWCDERRSTAACITSGGRFEVCRERVVRGPAAYAGGTGGVSCCVSAACLGHGHVSFPCVVGGGTGGGTGAPSEGGL